MLSQRKRLILIVCLLFSTLFLFGCFFDMKRIGEITAENQEQLPIRSMKVTIDPSHREELFNQFQKFADMHQFEIEISDYGTGGESYLVWMLKENIKVIATHTPHDRKTVSIGFYNQSRTNPVSEETLETIDELIIDLQKLIKEIPDVTIVK